MAEKDYIERGKLLRKAMYICKTYGIPKITTERLKKAMADSTAADVVEVVRCKDCVYWEDSEKVHTPICCNIDGLGEPDADDFCSYGERKGQE